MNHDAITSNHQAGDDETTSTPPAGDAATSRSPDTRDALMRAGRDLFARRGYDGASVRAITAAAGANLGAVTYHFGSKRALYGAVLEAELAPLGDAVVRVGAGGGTALDRMAAIVEVYFEHLGTRPFLPRLMLQEISAGRRPPEPVVRIIRSVVATLGALQQEGEEDGSVRPGHPLLTGLSVIAQPIHMTLVAPMIQQITGSDIGKEARRRTLVEHATAFVRAGLAPREESQP